MTCPLYSVFHVVLGVSLRNSVEHTPDGEWGLFGRFRSYAAMPNSSAMKVACAIASSLATHLALPFRIIFTASIPCNVRQAVKNEPYPFASHVRFFTVRWSCSTTLFRYLHCRRRTRRGRTPSSFNASTAAG